MTEEERKQMDLLLSINSTWLINYMSEMIIENENEIQHAIEYKDRKYLESVIEKHIY